MKGKCWFAKDRESKSALRKLRKMMCIVYICTYECILCDVNICFLMHRHQFFGFDTQTLRKVRESGAKAEVCKDQGYPPFRKYV